MVLAHLLPQGGRGGFKVYGFDFASLGPRNYELIPSSDLRGRLIRILEGLGGQAGYHMYWALGSQRSLFGWFVLCLVGASRRCYLGMSNSHLLLSWSGSNWCDTAPT